LSIIDGFFLCFAFFAIRVELVGGYEYLIAASGQ